MNRKLILINLVLLISPLLGLVGCKNNEEEISYTLAPNTPNTTSTIKKGIGVSRYNDKSEASGQKINDLNIGWYYNWGSDDPSLDSIEAEYVPMIWGAGDVNDSNLEKIKNYYKEGKCKYLLTFNEPDNNSQSNMSVDQAIALWPKLEALGIPLSSPCPADYSSGWLGEFMEKALKLNYRVDFIAVHCYQDFSISGIENKMKSTVLEVLYEKYKLPIWVTEYGAIDISVWAGGGKHNVNCTEKAAKKYIENSTKMLESLGYVERYAWFVDNFREVGSQRPEEAPYTSLYNDDNSISSTGRIYQNIASKTPLIINEVSSLKINQNEKMEYVIKACGGEGDYSFTTASLPKGLLLNTNGTLYGTPKDKGTFKLKITVTDSLKQTTYRYINLIVE